MASNTWYYIISAFGAVVFIALVGKRAGWFKIISGTNALLKEQNEELRNQNIFLKGHLEASNKIHEQDKKDWAARHSESMIEIAKLQGNVATLTTIPLQSIDDSLKALLKYTEDNAKSNKAILEQLRDTASIAAEDRDVLTNQNLHIKTEVHKVMETDNK